MDLRDWVLAVGVEDDFGALIKHQAVQHVVVAAKVHRHVQAIVLSRKIHVLNVCIR